MQILKVGVALASQHHRTKTLCVVTNPYKCAHLVNLITWSS